MGAYYRIEVKGSLPKRTRALTMWRVKSWDRDAFARLFRSLEEARGFLELAPTPERLEVKPSGMYYQGRR
jgi:hypothetical protein